MKKTKKVIFKGNAEAIKKYNNQKFLDKGVEFLGSIIGIIIFVLIFYSFQSFKEYWTNKEDLKKLLKQENQSKLTRFERLKIKDNVCKDFAKDTISRGDENKECDAIAILRKRIDDNKFGFLLPDKLKQDKSFKTANKLIPIKDKKVNNNLKKTLSSKKELEETKILKVKKETKISGCLEGDCFNNFSKKNYSNGHYIGEFKNKKEDGQGRFIWTSGNEYTGEWKDGNRTGQGTFIWTDGAKYSGDFLDGERTGKGTMNYSDGGKYTGDFLNGERHGKGTLTWSDGNKYDGDFVNNIRDGEGTYTWTSGDKYNGDFVNNIRDGEGTYTWTSGNKYIGEWKDGDRTGQGTFIWKDGNKYFGEFYKGKMNGEGTFIFGEDNSMMIGEFVSDEINDGVIILPDGFKLGVFKKNGKISYTRVQNTNQNIDLLAKQLKRNNNLQTSRMLLDISKSLMGSKKNRTPLNLNNLNIGGGFLSGSSSSGMYKTCRYSSSLGTKTKTVFSSAPCPMAY